MEDEYYKAYEERYKKVHESNNLWEIPKPTPEVLNTINKYKNIRTRFWRGKRCYIFTW